MKIYLFDSTKSHENLLPLSYTRPLADFRCGILTIKEKWERLLKGDCAYYPVDYLREKFGSVTSPEEEALYIAGNLLPDESLCNFILNLKSGEGLSKNGLPLIARCTLKQFEEREFNEITFEGTISEIEYVYDIFLKNGEEIKKDFRLVTKNRTSAPLPPCVRPVCDGKAVESRANEIFIEEGAVIECVSLNVCEGPIYIGKNSVLMEGACLRGPFAICEESEVRMGARIYEGTTIGPHCKVGGEVSNTIFFGYSNKSHDGYLGNAVIGEWCNIGAGVNASNLKNDYSLIRLWNYATHSFMRTDLQFCGLIMGDHSKIGVNCMINTATVVGVGVNIHGAGFPRTFIPCFSEGSPGSGFSQVPLKKFMETAERVMSRRNIKPSEKDKELLKTIYDNNTR